MPRFRPCEQDTGVVRKVTSFCIVLKRRALEQLLMGQMSSASKSHLKPGSAFGRKIRGHPSEPAINCRIAESQLRLKMTTRPSHRMRKTAASSQKGCCLAGAITCKYQRSNTSNHAVCRQSGPMVTVGETPGVLRPRLIVLLISRPRRWTISGCDAARFVCSAESAAIS